MGAGVGLGAKRASLDAWSFHAWRVLRSGAFPTRGVSMRGASMAGAGGGGERGGKRGGGAGAGATGCCRANRQLGGDDRPADRPSVPASAGPAGRGLFRLQRPLRKSLRAGGRVAGAAVGAARGAGSGSQERPARILARGTGQNTGEVVGDARRCTLAAALTPTILASIEDVGRPADHDQVLDIVATDEDQLAPAVHCAGFDHGKPGRRPRALLAAQRRPEPKRRPARQVTAIISANNDQNAMKKRYRSLPNSARPSDSPDTPH